MNIVCTIDERYVQHCGVMLCSLFTNSPRSQFNIYLLTDGLRKASARRLVTVCSTFGQALVIKQVDVSLLRSARVSPDEHVSLATYYRILIPRLLPADVDKALFLDSDLIVRREIAEFYDQSLENATHAAIPGALSEDDIKRLAMPDGSLYFNAGVLLLNLKLWRAENVSQRILDYMNAHPGNLRWWDQDALNAVLHSRWRACPPKWNAQSIFFSNHPATGLGVTHVDYEEAVTNPCIVHFTGSHACKPWLCGCTHPFKHEYYNYLRRTPWKTFKPADQPRVTDRLKAVIKLWLALAGRGSC